MSPILPIVLAGLLTGALLQEPGAPGAADLSPVTDKAEADSLGPASFRLRVNELTTPELNRRNAARLSVQRRGYSSTLESVMREDGLGALLTYLRMQLHIEFFLPHDQIYAYISVVQPAPRRDGLPGFATFGGSATMPVPLQEDWTFPPDPWAKTGQ